VQLSLPWVTVAAPRPPVELRSPRARVKPRRRGQAVQIVVGQQESIELVSPSGQRLLRVCRSLGGTRLELADESVMLRVMGRFALEADEVDFVARRGPLSLTAVEDDVVARGQTIRLN
jgi:hypothetical protein